MSINQKFNESKERLITAAQRVAGAYLLSKYGSVHLMSEPKVELTHQVNPISNEISFSGSITCYANDGLLQNIGVNMTVNENDVEVTSEDVVAKVTNALNAQEEHSDHVVAALDSFKLTDDGSKYLKVSHSGLQDANLGLVGKNEWVASPDKSALLQSIVKDAMLETPISFTGEFKEPMIESAKKSDDKGVKITEKEIWDILEDDKKWEEATGKKPNKSSWLTAGMFDEKFECDECHSGNCTSCQFAEGCECDHAPKNMKPMAIKEDMPMASMSDSMAQMAQLESQTISAAKEKIKTQAANALISMLNAMGYGSAKIAEVSESKDGFDFMAAVDDAGAVKAVSIPVVIKEAQVILPKKSLVSALISKGLDVRAKLSEQFDFDTLEKIAAIEEKAAYEAKEAEDILNEKPVVTKEASGSTNEMFLSETDTLELQKHLIPNHEDLKKGDKISDGNSQWEIVDTEWQQNDKNKDSSSIWKLRKCAPPKSDEKEPETKIKI